MYGSFLGNIRANHCYVVAIVVDHLNEGDCQHEPAINKINTMRWNGNDSISRKEKK